MVAARTQLFWLMEDVVLMVLIMDLVHQVAAKWDCQNDDSGSGRICIETCVRRMVVIIVLLTIVFVMVPRLCSGSEVWLPRRC